MNMCIDISESSLLNPFAEYVILCDSFHMKQSCLNIDLPKTYDLIIVELLILQRIHRVYF